MQWNAAFSESIRNNNVPARYSPAQSYNGRSRESAIYWPIEATGSNGSKGAMRGPEIVRGHYVFSGQRHFASTIFADQILIVGWRLSKEAWPPVGSLSATRCTNVSLLLLLFLSRCLSRSRFFPERVPARRRRARRCTAARIDVPSPPPRIPRVDANRIELSGSQVIGRRGAIVRSRLSPKLGARRETRQPRGFAAFLRLVIPLVKCDLCK